MLALRQRSQKDPNRACDVALRPGWLLCDRDDTHHASYGIANIITATKLATWHCGLMDSNHACLVRICGLTDGIRARLAAA